MVALIGAFFVTALLYASVGFGGGSTYAALLALSGVDYRVLPMIALCCNIVVVAGSSVRFARAGVTPWRGALVLTAIGAPAALLGGLTPISADAFFMILGMCLIAVALLMCVPPVSAEGARPSLARFVPLAAAPLGYIAGLVGIGGGIFLAPLLHLARWDKPRAIAATASVFILVNSIFGLAGQIFKGGEGRFLAGIDIGLPLILAVVIGGQIGSLLALKVLPPHLLRWGTAALVFLAGVRLLLSAP